MNRSRLKRISIYALLALCAAIGVLYLYPRHQSALPPGIAAGNGRLEATEVDNSRLGDP